MRSSRARPGSRAPDAVQSRGIAHALSLWFSRVARDLPWRRDPRPYAIWVSEIMLQQTRVETVVPYFERFLESFPDVAALAAAPLDEVLARWAGLGYYHRARSLHLAAREVTARFGGELPSDVERLQQLAGIGRYTAGAIASLAYGRQAAVVDGNVARVLSRFFGIAADARTARGARQLWDLAERLVPKEAPGRFNEALMELGATVCGARVPRCDACPISRGCVARRTGQQRALPIAPPRRPRPEVRLVALVVRDGPYVLVARRAPIGMFAGMWEPPMLQASPRASLAMLRAADLSVTAARAGSVRHLLSHRELVVQVLRVELDPPSAGRGRGTRLRRRSLTLPGYDAVQWRLVAALRGRISALSRKILRAALGEP